MKKHYFFNFLLLLIPVSAFILMSNSSGRTSGSSGSPGDGGNTCAECHQDDGANIMIDGAYRVHFGNNILSKDFHKIVKGRSLDTVQLFYFLSKVQQNRKDPFQLFFLSAFFAHNILTKDFHNIVKDRSLDTAIVLLFVKSVAKTERSFSTFFSFDILQTTF